MLQETGQLDGEQYEIVLDWGYSGVIIRDDEVDPSINSYSYLFDDALAGHIAWFDTPWILSMAHVTLGLESDPLDATPEDLQASKEYAIEKTKNLHSIWVDYTADVGRREPGQRLGRLLVARHLRRAEGRRAGHYIKPKEGVFTWAEGLILRSDTENYHHAHAYADAWADVEVAQRLVTTWGYGHSNLDLDLTTIDPDVVEVFGLEDPETVAVEWHLRRVPTATRRVQPGLGRGQGGRGLADRARALMATETARPETVADAPAPEPASPPGAVVAAAAGGRRPVCWPRPRSG